MLAFVKQFLPYTIFFAALIFALRAFAGKPEWLLWLVIALFPLRNVIDKIQALPVGWHFTDIILGLLLLTLLGRVMGGQGKAFAKSPVNGIAFVLILYTFFSVLLGSVYLGAETLFDIKDSRIQDWKNYLLLPVLFFLTLNHIQNRKLVWQTVLAICLTMLLMNAYVVQQISWFSSLVSRDKISGTFSYLGPNEVAAFYNQYSVLLVALFLFMRRSFLKLALLGLILTNIFCVLFLFSRGAYLGFAVGLFFIFAFKKRVFLIPLVLILLFWQTALPEKVKARIEQTHDEFGELDPSAMNRIVVWQKSMDVFSQNPIVGIGFGSFRHLGFELGDTHNIYVKILVEQGLVGIVIFLLLILSFFVQGMRLYSHGDDDLAKGLGLGLAACVIVMLVNNFFGDRWTYTEISSNLWVFAALVARLNILKEETSIKSVEKNPQNRTLAEREGGKSVLFRKNQLR